MQVSWLSRTRRVGVGIAAAALALSACGGSSSSNSTASGGSHDTLTFATGNAASSLDPAKDFQIPFRSLSYEEILHLNPDGSLGEALATKWGYVGTGNKVFEFTLRENAKFSDGTAVNAQAVKTWLDYFPTAKGPYSGQMKIASVETNGDWTVRINLAKPNPVVGRILASSGLNWGSVASAAVVSKDPTQLATATFGAGPYVLDATKTVAGDTYSFLPNKYYYDKSKVHWKRVVIKVIANPATRFQALQAGEVDAATGHFSTNEKAKGIKDLQVFTTRLAEHAFDITDATGLQVKALGDVRVRQALNYAVDRAGIAKAVYGGQAEPSSEMASLDGYTDDLVNRYPYDPEKAKALLKEAGYAGGFTVNVATEDFPGPDFTQVAQAVAANWEAIGLKVKLKESKTSADYLANMKGPNPIGHTAPQFDRPMFSQYATFLSPGGFGHPGKWTDPEIDKLYAEGAAADDSAPFWQKISARVTEQAYMVPVAATIGSVYASGSIANVKVTNLAPLPYLPEWKPSS